MTIRWESDTPRVRLECVDVDPLLRGIQEFLVIIQTKYGLTSKQAVAVLRMVFHTIQDDRFDENFDEIAREGVELR